MDSVTYWPKSSSILHSSLHHPLTRSWNCRRSEFTSSGLMYPLFIVEDDSAVEEIASMPGVFRYGVNKLVEAVRPLIPLGLKSVLLFGVLTDLPKDLRGSNADSLHNPVIRAIPVLRANFPDLVIACDVCLCPYTKHGFCGIADADLRIDNSASITRLQEIAVHYALAGAHMVAPSDMMDGRIGAIKKGLRQAGLESRVSVLSYAAKFCSSFYGPFRDAAKSAPSCGDRKGYQLPPGSTGMARRAVRRDVEEGADMLMVKPGLAYLDLVKQTKDDFPEYPLFVYQVSGEYAMLYHASKAGALDLLSAVLETMTSFFRAGADCVITYYTPQILQWLKDQNIS